MKNPPHADQTVFCLALLDSALTIRKANRRFLLAFQDSIEVVGRSFCELFRPDAQVPLRSRFAQLLEGRQHHFSAQPVMWSAGSQTFTGALDAAALGDARRVSAVMVAISLEAGGTSAREEPHLSSVTSGKPLAKVDARIIEGMARGMTTAALAERVHLSRQGVEYRVTGLLRRLRVSNRTALVSRAYSTGMLLAGTWPPRINPDVAE